MLNKITGCNAIHNVLTTCRNAALEITGYATAIFLAEILVKIGMH